MRNAQEVLDLWIAENWRLSAASFVPTAEEPVLEIAVGQLDDGALVQAYGVVHYGWGYDGGKTAHPAWAWYLNRNDALRRVLTESYRYTEEGESWLAHQPLAQKEYERLERREIGFIDEVPVIAFRYAECESRRVPHWRIGCDEAEALRMLRRVVWHFHKTALPGMQYPDPQDPTAQIPEIMHHHYGSCPETGEDLYRYGMFDADANFRTSELLWFETLENAQRSRVLVEETFRDHQAELQFRRDQKAVVDLFHSVCQKEEALTALPWYWGVRTMVDQKLVIEYEAKIVFLPDHGQINPVELMAQCQEWEAAINALRAAIDETYLERAMACESRGLKERLTALLDHWCPTCILCGEGYQRGDLDTVLVLGELRLTGCGCPERGWDERNTEAPAIVQAVHSARRMHLVRGQIPELFDRADYKGWSTTTIFAVRYNGVALIRWVLVNESNRLQPALSINTAALLELPQAETHFVTSCTYDPVWERVTLPAVQAERYRRAEERVQDGTVMKIAFEFGELSKRWFADVRDVCGMRRFVVDPQRCGVLIQANVLYYCDVDPMPENWRPRMTEYARPYLAVPSHSVSELGKRAEARPVHRAQQASGGKGGFGTFADLLRSQGE